MTDQSANLQFFTEKGVTHPFPKEELKYKNWLLQVAAAEVATIDIISYIFCSDDYLLDINIKHLGHDYYTDIITFPYREKTEIQSDIFISIDRVKENALEYQEIFEDELHRVMVHGLLHLIGYGDKTEEQSVIMRAKENHYVALFKTL